jgi:hypothetical protein
VAGTAYQYWSAQTEEFVDLLKADILNAPKVARTALQDITSVAGLLVTRGYGGQATEEGGHSRHARKFRH